MKETMDGIPPSLTRGEALVLAATHLRAAGLEEPDREARWLVSTALQCEPLELIIRPKVLLNDDERMVFAQWLIRRAAREPLARIHGLREFWGLPFGMNEATLEPRPDTETLVECVLKHFSDKAAPQRILDIGTGTGCILLSLLHEYKDAQGVATDKSARALQAAQQNAAQLGLKNRVQFMETEWAEGVDGAFDVIVSNPPYIATDELNGLQPEVKQYDPIMALDGGADGLNAYRAIIPQAKKLLRSGGLLAVEVGHLQAGAVSQLMREAKFDTVGIRPDLQHIPRVVFAVS